jgi:hypothetical protein
MENQEIFDLLQPYRQAGWTWKEIGDAMGFDHGEARKFYIDEQKAGEVAKERYLRLIADYKRKYGNQVGDPPSKPSTLSSAYRNYIETTSKLEKHPARFKPKRPITQCYWDMVDAAGMKTCGEIVDKVGTSKHHIARLLQGVVLIKRDGLLKQGLMMGLDFFTVAKLMQKNGLTAWGDNIAAHFLCESEKRRYQCPWAGADFSNEVYK